jgi:hypothetical protein
MSATTFIPSPARTIVYTGWVTPPPNAIPVPMVWTAKNPADVLDFSVDIFAWLADGGDDIPQVITLTPLTTVKGDVAIASPLIVGAGLITSWLSYGQAGGTYGIEFSISTLLGRTATFEVMLPILNVLPNPTLPTVPPVPVTWQFSYGRMDFRTGRNLSLYPLFA